MANSFDPVVARWIENIANVNTVTQSAVTFIQAMRVAMAEAVQLSEDAGATPEQLQSFADMDAALDSHMADLAAAIANEP